MFSPGECYKRVVRKFNESLLRSTKFAAKVPNAAKFSYTRRVYPTTQSNRAEVTVCAAEVTAKLSYC